MDLLFIGHIINLIACVVLEEALKIDVGQLTVFESLSTHLVHRLQALSLVDPDEGGQRRAVMLQLFQDQHFGEVYRSFPFIFRIKILSVPKGRVDSWLDGVAHLVLLSLERREEGHELERLCVLILDVNPHLVSLVLRHDVLEGLHGPLEVTLVLHGAAANPEIRLD